jgi:hypothetical protein
MLTIRLDAEISGYRNAIADSAPEKSREHCDALGPEERSKELHSAEEMRLGPAQRISWREAEALEHNSPLPEPFIPSDWMRFNGACALATPPRMTAVYERLLGAAAAMEVCSCGRLKDKRHVLSAFAWRYGTYSARARDLHVDISRLTGRRDQPPTTYDDVHLWGADVFLLFAPPA